MRRASVSAISDTGRSPTGRHAVITQRDQPGCVTADRRRDDSSARGSADAPARDVSNKADFVGASPRPLSIGLSS